STPMTPSHSAAAGTVGASSSASTAYWPARLIVCCRRVPMPTGYRQAPVVTRNRAPSLPYALPGPVVLPQVLALARDAVGELGTTVLAPGSPLAGAAALPARVILHASRPPTARVLVGLVRSLITQAEASRGDARQNGRASRR